MNKSYLALIYFLFALSAICITTFSNAQADPQTVGVFQNEEGSFNGYTLVAASGSNYTHLIDNCGYEIASSLLLSFQAIARILPLGNSSTS